MAGRGIQKEEQCKMSVVYKTKAVAACEEIYKSLRHHHVRLTAVRMTAEIICGLTGADREEGNQWAETGAALAEWDTIKEMEKRLAAEMASKLKDSAASKLNRNEAEKWSRGTVKSQTQRSTPGSPWKTNAADHLAG
jgi:hypothetical protein